jgi:hypothetical protein
MKSFLSIPLCSIALVACASQSEPTHRATTREAGLELSAATAALEAAQARALPQSLVAPDTVQVNYLGPCEGGGSAAITGSYDYSTASADSAWDLDAAFSGCTDSDGVLDGTLHWTQTVTGAAVAQALTGTLAWQGSGGSASCTFDLTIATDAAGVHYHGTVCGYDVTADLGL